jgi:hypothetical protein
VQHVGQTSEHTASRASDNGSDFHSTKRKTEDVRNDLKRAPSTDDLTCTSY